MSETTETTDNETTPVRTWLVQYYALSQIHEVTIRADRYDRRGVPGMTTFYRDNVEVGEARTENILVLVDITDEPRPFRDLFRDIVVDTAVTWTNPHARLRTDEPAYTDDELAAATQRVIPRGDDQL